MQNNIKYSYEIFWKIHHLLGKYSCPSLPSYMMGMPLSPPSLGIKIDVPVTEFMPATCHIMATSDVYEDYCNHPILLPD